MFAVRRGDILAWSGGGGRSNGLSMRWRVVAMLPRPKEMRGCGHSARASHARFASRLRRDLQAEGVVISEMGKASSGRDTVVTLRLPSGAKSALAPV